MSNCSDQSFYKYFNENMEGMGLAAPQNLFSSIVLAAGTAKAILTAIDMLGKTATIGMIIGATVALEKLAVVTALSAAYYVGAVIGSMAIATGRYLSCGATISDVILFAQQNQIHRPWLTKSLVLWPGIINPKQNARILYRDMMVVG